MMRALDEGAALTTVFFFFVILPWAGPAFLWTLETVFGVLHRAGQT